MKPEHINRIELMRLALLTQHGHLCNAHRCVDIGAPKMAKYEIDGALAILDELLELVDVLESEAQGS